MFAHSGCTSFRFERPVESPSRGESDTFKLRAPDLRGTSWLIQLFKGPEQSQPKVTAVAQADRTYDRPVEEESHCKADIDRRLRTALPSAHEVPERERLPGPVEQVYVGGRETSNDQLRLDLANEG